MILPWEFFYPRAPVNFKRVYRVFLDTLPRTITSAHLFVYSNHVVDLSHVLLVLVGVGHVLADVENVPEPTEPEISAERAPPQHALEVSAQVEMVQAAHAAHQPQQICERLALVAACAVFANAAAAAHVTAVAVRRVTTVEDTRTVGGIAVDGEQRGSEI